MAYAWPRLCFPQPRSSRTALTFALLCLALPALTAQSAQQTTETSNLAITPTSVTLLVGSNAELSVNDVGGRSVADARWSVDPPIATLEVDDKQVILTATEPGRATLTASVGTQSASAAISIVSANALPPATVRWYVLPTPGFETLLVLQAMPNAQSDVEYYSVEWSKSANALLRAFGESGQQLWMTQLSSEASPLSLKNTVPQPGEVLLNKHVVNDHSQFILGDKTAFAVYNSSDPSTYHLPPDGQNILVRGAGDESGGVLLLERGRFRDSLVDITPAGNESWRFHSEGRLAKDWTVNSSGDIGIVETLAKPLSSALLILDSQTGTVRFKIPIPNSSSTINGYRCADPVHNVLTSVRPSLAGSVFTSADNDMYVQVEVHDESQDLQACQSRQYSFDDSLRLLRVSPNGEADWRTFQHSHADGNGPFIPQPRVFAGETIPDGHGGVLAAWTYSFPGSKDGEKLRFEARLSRIGPEGQHDYTLPMPYWTLGISSLFDENMVLGEANAALYASNGPQLVRFDIKAGEVSWLRHPPTGSVKLQHSTAGGGLLVANAGRLVYFDDKGNGVALPWTVAVSNPNDIGLIQADIFDKTPLAPLQLRELAMTWRSGFIAVEDGAPYGRGALLFFDPR